MHVPKAAAHTKYETMFRHTAWGKLWCIDRSLSGANKVVFDNRDEFAQKWSLREFVASGRADPRIPRYVTKQLMDLRHPWLDHVEVYKDQDGDAVVLISPYANHDDDLPNALALKWQEVPMLYGDGTRSFVMRVQRRAKRVERPRPGPSRQRAAAVCHECGKPALSSERARAVGRPLCFRHHPDRRHRCRFFDDCGQRSKYGGYCGMHFRERVADKPGLPGGE